MTQTSQQQAFDLFVSDKEDDVPTRHAGEVRSKASIEGSQAFLRCRVSDELQEARAAWARPLGHPPRLQDVNGGAEEGGGQARRQGAGDVQGQACHAEAAAVRFLGRVVLWRGRAEGEGCVATA